MANSSDRTLSAALLVALLAGCGAPQSYLRPNSDLGAIKTVSVLPFENVTNDKLAAERVQRIFLSELLNTRAFDVVEPGLATRIVRRDNIDVATLGPEEIKKLGKELKVDGLFLGSLIEYDEGRSGGNTANPRVTLQLRLVETETGSVVWSTNRSGGGATVASRLFGFGGTSATQTAEELVRKELSEVAW